MPFPFYDVSAPSPSTKNSITRTATDFGYRDFLLLKNIGPQYPNALNIGPSTVRIGEPVLETSINGDTNVIPFGLPLEIEGLFRYDIAVLPNRFKNDNPNAPSLTNIEDITQTQGIFGQVDFPQGTQSYPTSPTQQITELGLLGKTNYAEFRKQNTLYNLYLDTTQQTDVSDLISLQPIGASQQINGYLNEYGALNLGGGGTTQIADILGSVINGQGIGFSNTGIVTNFDIRSSLAGRILGATGVINDTRLGSIGAQQLALALANNAAFNVQEELLGTLNIRDNILSLVKEGKLSGLRPNYQITVPTPGLGRIADYTSRILGFTLPKSYLSDDGSIFLSESNSANIERANSMLLNTGRGQVKSLISNVNANLIGTGQFDNPSTTAFRSGYAPGYKNNRGNTTDINPSLYAFYNADKSTIYNFVVSDPNNVIPEISYNREQMVSEYGFKSPEETFTGPRGNSGYENRKLSDVGFTWTTSQGGLTNSNYENEFDELLGDKKSLLTKTQKLFNSKGMKNIVTAKGDMNNSSSQITTANGGGFSKGSAVLAGANYNQNGQYAGIKDGRADQVYCRSWTTLDRYEYVNQMIRHRGLERKYPYRNQMEGSVLDDNGFVKIAPYTTDSTTDPKKYMFSIENLAWSDSLTNLLECEKGPGDLTTGKQGRIMWFPPYNISINESSNVNWESTNFIGRGEPVYTYNNTERSGTLSFSIIVDHPSYVNSFRGPNGPDDNYVASFFAGCVDPSELFVNKLISVTERDEMLSETVTPPQVKTVTPETSPLEGEIKIYFPNDRFIYDSNYENGKLKTNPSQYIDYSQSPSGVGNGLGSGTNTQGQIFSNRAWIDRYNYGLNAGTSEIGGKGEIYTINGIPYSGFNDTNLIPALNTYLNEKCPNCIVKITGYASPQGTLSSQKNKDNNIKLAKNRAKNIYDAIQAGLHTNVTDATIRKKLITYNGDGVDSSTGCKASLEDITDGIDCKLPRRVGISVTYDPNNLPNKTTEIAPDPIVQTTNFNVNTKITNRFYTECSYFEKLTQTDKFVFDSFRDKIKYFHPAFHSTTPEGLNSRLTFLQQCTRQGPTNEKQGASNLAFGRPPVCILRFGDFFHTKVVFDSVSIDYEPFVLDLNPEGVGVQPMMANVTLSFKFLGGSSLLGPINKLQNALSFNYYANTQVYDPRADYISQVFVLKNPWTLIDGVTDINKAMTETTITPITTGPEINQPAAADKAVGPTQPQPANQPAPSGQNNNTGTEIDKIVFAKPTLELKAINCVFNLESALSNDYDFRMFLSDNTNITYEIGVGKINSVDLSQPFVFSLTDSPNGDITNKLTDGKEYFLIAKFNNSNKTQTFTYQINQ